MIPHKKSQITVFMIIGLILIAGAVVFFYSTQKVQKDFEPEIKIIQEQVPVEFEPIKSYASDCAYSAGVEGIKIIGKQGGYISFADRTLNKESFAITQNPTESDAVLFAKESDLKIPYWWYLKSANDCNGDCTFASKRPQLRHVENSIEKQLERFIDLKFMQCVNNFKPFAEQGFKITQKGKVKTDVTIASEDVLVLIEYPLTIEKQDRKKDVKQFSARIPINLNNVYELATKITNLQIKHHYLEKHVLNLLVAFSGKDKEKLPPMSDMSFSFGSSLSWQKSDIKNKITSMLASYIPLFQVDGTYNYERNFFDSELKQRLYDATILPVANSSFEDLAVEFTYLDFWPSYFNLNCKGEICKPSSVTSFIPLGLQTYRFAYDLSFPVLVEIQDPYALNGQGYAFNFFLEGNIRDNKHMQSNFTPLEILSVSEKSQLCDVRTSGNTTIKIVDATTQEPINDAQVLYTIIDESCFIGSTDANGILTEQFPVGIGGVVNAAKDRYIGKAVEFDPQVNTDASLEIELQPIYTRNIIVQKKNLVKTFQGWQFDNTAVGLSEKESATITLTRSGDENELEFSSVANYEGQQNEKSEMEISGGNYVADIQILLNERIVVPEKEKCVTVFLFKKECYTIPKVDFGETSTPGQERFPSGGLRLNLTLSPDDLKNHDTIILYAVNIDIAGMPEQERLIEDLEQLGKIEEYSSTYQLALQPTYK